MSSEPTPQASTLRDAPVRSRAVRAASGGAIPDRLRPLPCVELGYSILLVSAFVLPAWIGYRAWVPALGVAAVLALLHGVLTGSRPRIPLAMAAYLAVYLLAGIHSDPDTFSVVEAGKFFGPPVFALAIAWAAGSSQVRARIVLLGLLAVAIQLPVVVGEVMEILVRYGRDGASHADSVRGLLDTDQGAALAQSGLIAACLLISAAYVGKLSARVGVAGGCAALSLGLLTSTRASYIFVPAVLVAFFVITWIAQRSMLSLSLRPRTALILALVSIPTLVFGTEALYKGANTGVYTLAGLDAGLSRGDKQQFFPGLSRGDKQQLALEDSERDDPGSGQQTAPAADPPAGAGPNAGGRQGPQTGGAETEGEARPGVSDAGGRQGPQTGGAETEGEARPGVSPRASGASHAEAAESEAVGEAASDPIPPSAQPTLLPGRGRQFTLALELSVEDGVDVALLGRGIGATRFKDQALLSATGQTADPITREEQNTNGTWIPRTISETGYLGLAAFFGLLGYMVLLWWRNLSLLRERSWDAALIFALPGIALLTLLSAVYNTILAVQPYATLLWALLGVAIAIDAARRGAETGETRNAK